MRPAAHVALRHRIDCCIVLHFRSPLRASRAYTTLLSIVWKIVCPHQRRPSVPARVPRVGKRRRPRQAKLSDVRFIDLLQLAVALFVLGEAIGEPGAGQSVLGGTGGFENFSVNGARLLGDDRGNESESGDDARGPQGRSFDVSA